MVAGKKKRVLVAGDTTLDWYIVSDQSGAGKAAGWRQDTGSRIVVQRGGAELVRDLLADLADDIEVIPGTLAGWAQDLAANLPLAPTDPRYNHATSVWAPFPKIAGDKEHWVWRIREVQGIQKATSTDGRVAVYPPEEMPRGKTGIPDAIVIDDAGLSVRETDGFWRQLQPIVCCPGEPKTGPRVLLKTSWPVGQGQLIHRLLDTCASRLLVLTTVDDLRRSEFQISEGISWEAAAQDLTWEMAYNPALSHLRRAACVIVSFGPSGVWLSHGTLGASSTANRISPILVFDPKHLEGDWESQRPGMLIGYTSTLAACFTRCVVEEGEAADVCKAAETSLNCMRALHEAGLQFEQSPRRVKLPSAAIREAYAAKTVDYGRSRVPLPVRSYTVPGLVTESVPAKSWSILRDNCPSWDSLLSLAEAIVLRGPKEALKAVPIAQFGYLTTADRREVESFRSVYRLILEYVSRPEYTQPLSIGVFGPPGSGKSFGVTQVAKQVAGDRITKLTFNLSQFEDSARLIQAFHLLRDCSLSGKIPLVFWDEFDCVMGPQPLYWLKHFLSPMQDGEFMEGQVMHPLGKAIFVFAGGTAAHLLDLGADLQRQEKGESRWREVKGPDFVSRLKGYINIVGIDRSEDKTGGASGVPDSEYVVRRAIVLRSILERNVPGIIDKDGVAKVDSGLLRAILLVWNFRHGARSLEAIITMSKLQRATSFQPSALPPALLLELHVRAREFLGIYNQRVEFAGDELERLAAANHAVYLASQVVPNLPDYADLDERRKQKNRDAVRAWPHMLASIGYTYASSNDQPIAGDSVDRLEEADVEYLAKLEHDRWIVREVANGTVYDETRRDDTVPRRSPYMVPWTAMTREALSEAYPAEVAARMGLGPLKDTSLDLQMIRQIPQVLEAGGLGLVRIGR